LLSTREKRTPLESGTLVNVDKRRRRGRREEKRGDSPGFNEAKKGSRGEAWEFLSLRNQRENRLQ